MHEQISCVCFQFRSCTKEYIIISIEYKQELCSASSIPHIDFNKIKVFYHSHSLT
jgi:hypothetical protein